MAIWESGIRRRRRSRAVENARTAVRELNALRREREEVETYLAEEAAVRAFGPTARGA